MILFSIQKDRCSSCSGLCSLSEKDDFLWKEGLDLIKKTIFRRRLRRYYGKGSHNVPKFPPVIIPLGFLLLRIGGRQDMDAVIIEEGPAQGVDRHKGNAFL